MKLRLIQKKEKSLAKVYIIAGDGSKERKEIIQTPKTRGSIREVSFPVESEKFKLSERTY